METLGNEALGKIMNVVDESRQQVELDSRRGSGRPQTSVLNILNSKNVGMDSTLSHTHTQIQLVRKIRKRLIQAWANDSPGTICSPLSFLICQT